MPILIRLQFLNTYLIRAAFALECARGPRSLRDYQLSKACGYERNLVTAILSNMRRDARRAVAFVLKAIAIAAA